MTKFAPAVRMGLVILGALLVVGAFLAVLYLGIGTNPPPLRVAVVVHDLPQGEMLKAADIRMVDQIIDPRLASLYVQEREMGQYLGAFVVETLRTGDPLSKAKLAIGGDATAQRRYALALKDPNDVVMSLSVNPEVIPAKIAPGDFVNILLASGADGGLSHLPDLVPTPDLGLPVDLNPSLVLTQVLDPPANDITLPLADLMLEHVPVLDVIYQTAPNATYSNGAGTTGDASPNQGSITAIVVKVPRDYQTLLMFGASVSKLRYAIASPALDVSSVQPQQGMDWAKYMRIYRWKEQQVLARGETLTQTIYPTLLVTSPLTLTTH